MSLFKKQQTGDDKDDTGRRMKMIFDDKLKKFANYLFIKTRHIEQRKLAFLLMLVCLSGSLCLWLQVYKSFNNNKGIQIQSIRFREIKPSHVDDVDDAVLKRIKGFHHYLDSLKKNDFLRYDSMMKSRPFLIDSIITIEQLRNK